VKVTYARGDNESNTEEERTTRSGRWVMGHYSMRYPGFQRERKRTGVQQHDQPMEEISRGS
jgi:hypothetical protein